MKEMRLYQVNPDNPVVSLNKFHWNRLNTYRVWKPLGLLVVAGLTPPDCEVTLIDENLGHADYRRLPKPDLAGVTAFTSQAAFADRGANRRGNCWCAAVYATWEPATVHSASLAVVRCDRVPGSHLPSRGSGRQDLVLSKACAALKRQ